MQGLASVVATNLARLAARVVIVVDEVDQLVSRGTGKAAAGAMSLETLFSLPRLPGSPAVAIVAIANAVDLLERTALLSTNWNCGTLLFEAYSKEQLKNIVVSRIKSVDGGEAALKTLGPLKVELRVRQVAKECGDCRQVLSLIEEAHFEAQSACRNAALSELADKEQGAEVLPVPKREARPLNQSNRNDPLQAIQQLPLEQQLLLSALATSKLEATKISDICTRYKELCRALKQPDNLGSKGQVNSALSALEQRGLLEMRSRGAGRGRGKMPIIAEATVELSVSCTALRESVVKAVPLLKRYME
jgi:Cdc6-like AAA superfamily ATPase